MVELAEAAQNAVEFVNANTTTKLREIAFQMLNLRDRAVRILEEAKLNADLHSASCNMVKRPGGVYYFYTKQHGGMAASIISPPEWGQNCPYPSFFGAFELQNDRTWVAIDSQIGDDKQMEVDYIVNSLREQSSLNALKDEGFQKPYG